MTKPRFVDHEAFRCLRMNDMDGFLRAVAGAKVVDFSDADLRGCDFRRADLANVDLRGAYLRDADLRGCDLRHLDLAGCSLHNAKIGGAWFPDDIPAAEIALSVQSGTRIRA